QGRFPRYKLPKELATTLGARIGSGRIFVFGMDVQGKPLVAAAGNTTCGRLGLKSDCNKLTFCKLPKEITKITTLCVGNYQTFLLGQESSGFPVIAATGANLRGELGLGDEINRSQFTRCRLPDSMVVVDSIELGENHIFIVGRSKNNEQLIAVAGANNYGQLGLGDYKDRNLFTLCPLPLELEKLDGVRIINNSTYIYGKDKQNKPILFGTGDNWPHYLGIGNKKFVHCFTRCVLPKELTKINNLILERKFSFILGEDRYGHPILAACGKIKIYSLAANCQRK
ncbi:MAG: hypothetical protein HYX60_03280, partial [Legionella longbeachae]|nr:hypothetical protein [Legionella longbeachae]